MSEKILASHLERTAFVYVRQSTQSQVEHNTESRRRQYGLADRARQLGWRSVDVIDDDLGCSGSGTTERKGFERLVAAVSMGKAGAVFSLEASRLARNNRDWHQLIDICGMVKTLIVDQDGIYDAGLLNDRLLLGLKGTMSEFELTLFRQRSHEALLQKASRGELYFTVPIGYVLSSDNRCEKDPDERIRSTVALVFAKFTELASARQVMLWFRHEGIDVPRVRYGVRGREVIWRPALYSAITHFLRNPVYAGVYAFGRTTTETYFDGERARHRVGKRLPQEKWHTLIKDHHEPYLSWDAFVRNRTMLAENANMKGRTRARGAAREGRALLPGLLRCARCGRKMAVAYAGKNTILTRYYCRSLDVHVRERCTAFGGRCVDAAVERTILDVIHPLSIEAALRAAERIRDDGMEKRGSMEQSLQQAEYEAQRAQRQYDAVDPENRLVADELERRWNEALEKANACRQALESFTVTRCAKKQPSVDELIHIAEDLPSIWQSENTDMRTKKMIVRTLIREIIVDIDKSPGTIELTIHWRGGSHSALRVTRPRKGEHRYTTDVETVEVVRSLSRVMPDAAIAATLNRLGRLTARGNTWTENRVGSLRWIRDIPGYDKERGRDVVTMQEAADVLNISPMSVHRLIRQGIIAVEGSIPYAPKIIRKETLASQPVQAAAQRVRAKVTTPLPADPNQQVLDLA